MGIGIGNRDIENQDEKKIMDIDFSNPAFTPEKIAYYSFGQGEKTLILIHGSFGSAMMWKMVIGGLMGKFKIVALDLQGHGMSREFDLAKTTMDDYANNIKSVASNIGGESVLVGHSMSGLIALMAAKNGVSNTVISIDPSPSVEVQGKKSSEGITDVYNVMDAGMPGTLEELMKAMPDIDPQMFPMMQKMLGSESGVARRQRKEGISISKEDMYDKKVLFMGAELGNSLKFGISAESTKKMATYYEKPYVEVAGASHPGMLAGKSSMKVVEEITKFLL